MYNFRENCWLSHSVDPLSPNASANPASILSFLFKSLYKSSWHSFVVIVIFSYKLWVLKPKEVKKVECTASDPILFEFLELLQESGYILRSFITFFGLEIPEMD